MELILKAMLLAGAVICAWAAYKVIHEYIIENRKGTPNEPEPPYKIEPPKSTEQLALPHKPIKWTFTNAPEPKREDRDLLKLLENWGSLDELKPKRKYTKRSKYWTDKRKKAAARKAKKKTRKSK